MTVLYEDNHIIIVNKSSSEIVQGDKTGDKPLVEIVKEYIKEKYHKPGNVFLGVVHRLDRPVSGVVVFARTGKALARLNEMFRTKDVHKTYWAIVANQPPAPEGELTHWLIRKEQQNKSFAYDKEVPQSKKAILDYHVIAKSDRYFLLEVDLKPDAITKYAVNWPKWAVPLKVTLNMARRVATPMVAFPYMHDVSVSSIPFPRRKSVSRHLFPPTVYGRFCPHRSDNVPVIPLI